MSTSINQILSKAKRLAKKGEASAAAELYQWVLQRFPQNKRAVQGLKSLSMPSQNSGNPGKGPTQQQINNLLGLFQRGNFNEVIRVGGVLVRQFPLSFPVFNILAAAYVSMKNYERAIACYKRVIELRPNFAEAYNNLGTTFLNAGDGQTAVPAFEKALALRPDYPEAHNNLGTVHRILGELEEAATSYKKAIKINPRFTDAYVNLGGVLRLQGKSEEAINTLEMVLQYNPDDPDTHNNFGLIHTDAGNHDMAIDFYRNALRINPSCIEAHHNLGNSLRNLGELESAMESYSNAIQGNPENIDIEHLYSTSRLPARFINVDILPLIDKASPNPGQDQENFDSIAAFTKAAIYHNQGRYKDAWECLIQANELQYKHLSEIASKEMKVNAGILEECKSQGPGAPTSSELIEGIPISLHILGPSRSGKSTLELIANSLPGVKRGFENDILERAVVSGFQSAGLPIEGPYSIDAGFEVESFKVDYLTELKSRVENDSIFTNTYPRNINYVEFATNHIPNSRFVFIKRTLEDVMLRIFMHRFVYGNPYAYSLVNIRDHVCWYYEMIDVFCKKYPEISIMIQYEDMVANPKHALDAVARLCGIATPDLEVTLSGDDRDSSAPYRDFMAAVLSG